MKLSKISGQVLIMTVVNIVMKSIGIWFNAYLTKTIGSSGIGLFQLIMTVYSLAVTFSCAGIKLATTRIAVEIKTLKRKDEGRSLALCITYAGICGSIIGFVLFGFSDLIALNWLDNTATAFPLKILSLSLPFVAMSSSLSGYYSAIDYIPQYSAVQMLEQGFRIIVVISLINRFSYKNPAGSCISIVAGMTASEIFSFTLASAMRMIVRKKEKHAERIAITDFLRIAVPDAAGTCIRSVLLTIEHLLIPKGFRKSGQNAEKALSAYGNIHGMALPLVLFPSAILSSLSSLLIPNLAAYNELGNYTAINRTVSKNLKRTFIFSVLCAIFFFVFSLTLSQIVYKTNEAAMYIKILSPLVPIMYTDMITDGMLKGLDQQVYSMKYNIIDSALCVGLVYYLLPKYSVTGYIIILYVSEIINFILSINRLRKICEIRYFPAHGEGSSILSRLKKCSDAPWEYGYQAYQGQKKRSQVP